MGSMAHGVIDVVVRPLGGLVLAHGTLWQTGDMVQMTGFMGAIPCGW